MFNILKKKQPIIPINKLKYKLYGYDSSLICPKCGSFLYRDEYEYWCEDYCNYTIKKKNVNRELIKYDNNNKL